MIIQVCKEFVNSNDKANAYLCRFHRLYLDGSYTGYNTYKYHIKRVKSLKTDKSLEKFAFQTFCKCIKIEFFENSSRVTNEIIKTFLIEGLGEKYDILIKELVQNVADFKEEHK